jgi:hypothetical protein
LRIFWSLLLLCTQGSCQKGLVLYLPKWKTRFSLFYKWQFFGSMSWIWVTYIKDVFNVF